MLEVAKAGTWGIQQDTLKISFFIHASLPSMHPLPVRYRLHTRAFHQFINQTGLL